MTNRMLAINSDERLALIGLFLMLIVARIADHLPQPASIGGLK
jgi:hypothetical protein